MKKTNHHYSTENSEEISLFKDAVGKVKPMVQDTIHAVKKSGKPKVDFREKKAKYYHAQFHFSDQYEPLLPTSGAMKYVRSDVDSYEAKCLRRGDYIPELTLDLHGLTQQQAKAEIAALIVACKKTQLKCACIVHGIGSKILKNKVPHWLVQHPDVMAFHQASLQWGGDGALLVLLDVEQR
jgi:DNA-nicking Smr family endonuclease